MRDLSYVRDPQAARHPRRWSALLAGDHPQQGFCLYIHPLFEQTPGSWPLLIAYHIPPVNYGDIAAPEDCERFGAALLGLDMQAYYESLCGLADRLAGHQA